MSPVVHVRLAEQPQDASQAEEVLQQVVDAALRKSGVLMAVNRLSKLDAVKAAPSIRWDAISYPLHGQQCMAAVSHCLGPVQHRLTGLSHGQVIRICFLCAHMS